MSPNVRHFIRFQLPAIVWAFVIFLLSSIPATRLPRFAHLFNDKFVHASIFFVLGLFIYLALEPKIRPASFDWRRLIIATSAVILYGVSDEFHQGFVPGRTVDVFDAAADSLGGFLSALVILAREGWKKRSLG